MLFPRTVYCSYYTPIFISVSVTKSQNIIFVWFYADWCGPCRMVSPLVDEIAEENPQYLVGKINVDEEPALAQAFGVAKIPI